jgi:hypothetical protein
MFTRPLILLFVIAACSSPRTQDGSLTPSDTTSLAEADTASEYNDNTEYADEVVEEEIADDTLASAFQTAIDETATELTTASVYTLTASFSGYESGTDAEYHFDEDMSLAYCNVTWSMEGSSGSYTYYFTNDELVAGEEQNSYNDYEETVLLHRKFKPSYGFTTTNGTEDDSNHTILGEADYISRNTDSHNELDRILSRIREYQDSVSIEDDVYTIRIENIVNYGEDFTETEQFKISKKLFDAWIKE